MTFARLTAGLSDSADWRIGSSAVTSPSTVTSNEPTGLHIETHGAGRSLVFSHGVGGNTAVWDGFIKTLEPSYRVVTWDQPGHGTSSPAASDAYGPRLAYESLTRVVGELDGVVLIGHSLGGYLAARFTIEHPEKVAALVLLATGPGFRSPDAMAKWNTDIRRSAEKQGRPETLVGLHEDSYVIDHLPEIACPTLALVGSEDTAFLGATDYIQKKIPGIERITIEHAGHMMPETHGAALAAIIADFLARRLA